MAGALGDSTAVHAACTCTLSMLTVKQGCMLGAFWVSTRSVDGHDETFLHLISQRLTYRC